jgi:hypothetical protein
MITVRDSCMTPEEISNIRRECAGDPHETPPKEGDSIEFDSYEELLKLCFRNEIPEEEARKFIYRGLYVNSVPLKGGKSKKETRFLFFKRFFELYPDFKTNPAT